MKSLFTLFFLSLSFCAMAQKEKTEEGTYTYTYSSDITPKAARLVAQERAKLAAIQEAFPGTITAQQHSHIISEGSQGSSNHFYSSGVSEVKGEWLADVREPQFTDPVYSSQNDLWSITCTVKGRIRELTWNKPEFSWQLMRNHIEDASETDEFQDNDDLFMTFQAPCDGYLCVYLSDERGMAQCLVPNDEDPNGIFRVKGNRRYVFFSDKHRPDDDQMATVELMMVAGSDIEYDQFYVFFSPNPFRKAQNSERQTQTIGGREVTLPGEVPYEKFQKWQLNQLSKDKELQREKKIISIRRKKS